MHFLMLISGDTTTVSAAEALLQAAPTSPEESWDNAHTLASGALDCGLNSHQGT